ncbi:ferric citrate ABC transporter ATPase [Erysipelotrichaceae bacterium]|nr:ferric citrate ABC transporter ATPase [Erysipelotrichaceae bacterium]
MIKVRSLHKKYHGRAVVKDVSFDIQEGKVTSFIGPNGAGKSTVLSLMSRLIALDSGTIEIAGKDISAWHTTALSKKLGILKQSNDIHVRLTVQELVAFGRFPYSQGRLNTEDHTAIAHALDFMDLGAIADRYLDELSGGQKQRAYIAMIIAQETDYILLDEPLNNLDIKHSIQMMKMLNRLALEKGKTIIVVLHDINFSASYSDYIIAMKDGRVIKEGIAKDIIQADILKSIYDIDLRVESFGKCQVCLYH